VGKSGSCCFGVSGCYRSEPPCQTPAVDTSSPVVVVVRIALSTEEDRTTATVNMYRHFMKFGHVAFEIGERTEKQTDRQTDRDRYAYRSNLHNARSIEETTHNNLPRRTAVEDREPAVSKQAIA